MKFIANAADEPHVDEESDGDVSDNESSSKKKKDPKVCRA